MRNFSKKLAFVLAAAMVFTAFAPAAKAEAAEDMAINRKSQTLYVNEGLNHKGAETKPEGLYGNVCEYDFYVANKPANWETAYTFDWSSSDPDVMTVGKAGLATAVAPGKADVVCVVTEKATGKATTLKAAVTVKANAETITITNAEDFDMQTVVAGDDVALQYKMVAKDGGKATDLVRWVAEPATGVTVKDGVFTFGEDAVATDYTLYAEAYQSDKYNQTTATSEKIVVTFVTNNTFEVKQDTNAQITVTFDAPVKAVGEVVVNRLYKGFELPVLVDKATLAEDGMSATITLFTKLVDKNEYLINIAGYETANLTASVGEPKTIAIYADQKAVDMPFEMVTLESDGAGSYKTVKLEYSLFDAAGVDVTTEANKKGTVFFEAANYSTDGTYYVSGNEVWFADADVDVTVVAEYQSNEWKDGAPVCSAKTEKLFMSEKKPPVIVTGLADWKVAGDWDNKKQSVPFGKEAILAVKLKLSEGDPVEAAANGEVVGYGSVRFEELNPEVAALNGNKVVFFKQGTAKIIVYYTYNDGTEDVELPIAQLNIETTPEVALKSIDLSKYSMTLGTVDKYDEATISVSAKDNYGDAYTFSKVEVIGLDDVTKAAMAKDVTLETGTVKAVDFTSELGKITLYGKELMSAVPNSPAQATLNFKVKVDDKLEKTFSVVLKNRGAANTEYIEIESEGFGVDVARTAKDDKTKAEKTASFTVYQYSNGIKVGTQAIQKYDASNITADAYYFKVSKDGNDVTDKVDVTEIANGKVTIKFSKTKTDANGYEVVDYTDFGAGNYVFTLYKGKKTNNGAVAMQMKSVVGAVTCNVGSYGNAEKKIVTLEGAVITDKVLRDAFNIKDAQGGDKTSATYYVKAQGVGETNMKYVYVEYITFYDEVETDVYAAYTVNVGIALQK